MDKREVKLKNMICWGAGDIVGNGTGTILGLWALYFYIQVAGLSPVQAGSIFAIGKIWDAINDPIIGYTTDNIRTKWGRRRVFLLFGAPLMLLYSTIWISGFDYIYYLMTYLCFNTAMSVLSIPWITLPSEMTSDHKIRTKMGSVRMVFSQSTAFLSALIPGLFLNYFADKQDAFMAMGATLSIIFMIPWLVVYFGTWETPADELPEPDSLSMLETMKKIYREMFSTFKLKTFRLHLLMYVGGFCALDTIGSLLVFFGVFIAGISEAQAGSALSIMSFAQFLGVFLFTWLAFKISNAKAYLVALAMVLGSLILYTSLGASFSNPFYIFVAISILLGFGRGGINLIPWVNYNFMSDIDEALTGTKRAGIYGSVMQLARKVTAALALMLVSSSLQWVGFQSGQENQTTAALSGLHWIFLALPIGFMLLAAWATMKYKLDAKANIMLNEELDRLRSGGKLEDATPETKSLIEELTGWEHKYTWGNMALKKAENNDSALTMKNSYK
ncbi:MAG: MFS transporter [Vibrio sp.]